MLRWSFSKTLYLLLISGSFQACSSLEVKDEVNLNPSFQTPNSRSSSESESQEENLLLENSILGFGGMYSRAESIDNGMSYPNPITGNYDCPDTYEAVQILGSDREDAQLFVCQKPLDEGELPVVILGGLYGYHSEGTYKNPTTNAASCPENYQAHKVLGSEDVDFELYFCSRTSESSSSVIFGYAGFLGNGREVSFSSLTDQAQSCSDNYAEVQTLGSTAVDWPLSYCIKSLSPSISLPSLEENVPEVEMYPDFYRGHALFGGMYSIWENEVNPNSIANPATNDFSCPDTYKTAKVRGAYLEADLFICYKPNPRPGEPSVFDFGGMFGSKASGVYNNPFTGTNRCPTGYTKQKILGIHDVDWDASYCYREQNPYAASQFSFAGLYVYNTSTTFYNNPLTNDTTCPANESWKDFAGYQIHGSFGLDWNMYMCGSIIN